MISYEPTKQRTILYFYSNHASSYLLSQPLHHPKPLLINLLTYKTQEHHIGDLHISLVTTPKHIISEDKEDLPSLGDLARTVRELYQEQGERYSIAIVQGMREYPAAAHMIRRTDVLTKRENVIDCFTSPNVISTESYQAFMLHESNGGKSESEVAAFYKNATTEYLKKGISPLVDLNYDPEKVTKTPSEHLSNLMDIINNQSAIEIEKRLRGLKCNILIYCLEDFKPAVEFAVSRLCE